MDELWGGVGWKLGKVAKRSRECKLVRLVLASFIAKHAHVDSGV